MPSEVSVKEEPYSHQVMSSRGRYSRAYSQKMRSKHSVLALTGRHIDKPPLPPPLTWSPTHLAGVDGQLYEPPARAPHIRVCLQLVVLSRMVGDLTAILTLKCALNEEKRLTLLVTRTLLLL